MYFVFYQAVFFRQFGTYAGYFSAVNKQTMVQTVRCNVEKHLYFPKTNLNKYQCFRNFVCDNDGKNGRNLAYTKLSASV